MGIGVTMKEQIVAKIIQASKNLELKGKGAAMIFQEENLTGFLDSMPEEWVNKYVGLSVAEWEVSIEELKPHETLERDINGNTN